MQLGSSSISSPSLTTPPTRDERWLAAVAYLPWFLAPLAVYLLRRRDSRFVAAHALRAALMHAAIVPLGALVAILAAIQLVLLHLLVGPGLVALGTFTMWIGCGLSGVGYWVLLGLAARGAFTGQAGDAGPLAALTRRLLACDPAVPPG